MAESGIPRLSVVLKQGRFIDRNPDVFHFDLNLEAATSERPVPQNAFFRSDRLGQAVIAYMVLRLVTDGQFDLDRSLSSYVTRSTLENSMYENLLRDHRLSRLTARRILSHQSGLANSRLDDPERKLTFIASPGKGFTYSDGGYEYLIYILELKSGRGLDELAKAYVFDALGMKESKFSRQARAANPAIAPTGSAWAFFTTAADFTNFMWTIRLENPQLAYEAFMSHIVYPTVGIRSPSILGTTHSEGRAILPPHLAWCLGWGTYQMPKIELGACSFIGDKGRELESYATVFASQNSTALTIFLVPASSKSAMPLILNTLLGEMQSPLTWLGF